MEGMESLRSAMEGTTMKSGARRPSSHVYHPSTDLYFMKMMVRFLIITSKSANLSNPLSNRVKNLNLLKNLLSLL